MKAGTGKTVKEIFAANKANGGWSSEKAAPKTLVQKWRDAYIDAYECFVPSLTIVEVGMLKNFVKKCPEGMAEAVMRHALSTWQPFLSRAQIDDGAFPLPDKPKVGFLLKHVGVAVNRYLEHDKAQKHGAAKAAVYAEKLVQLTANPVPASPKAKPAKMTLEEFQSIMGDEDHG